MIGLDVKVLENFTPISLADMESVRLMNRIDTKFITDFSTFTQIIPFLQQHYMLQQIEGNRIGNYHTIYYDTADKLMYLQHHNGRKAREKIRARQYVDSKIWFLEIKDKNNKGRTKKIRIAIPDQAIEVNQEAADFLSQKSLFTLAELKPHIENNFQRLTLVNKEKTERLTIDMNISFKNFENGQNMLIDEIVVIELKQDGNYASPMKSLLSDFFIHQSSFSKYCIGSALTNPQLKHNRFKKTFMQINKISNYKYGTNY